jgi:alanine racemase
MALDVRAIRAFMVERGAPASKAAKAPPGTDRVVTVRPTVADIDRAALLHNQRRIQQHVGPHCRVLAVVKADAYGHGAIETSATLVEGGAWGLAVSLVEEGAALREAGIFAPVIVLGGVPPGSEDMLVHRQLTPVVWSKQHLDMLAAAVLRAGARALPVHVKVDTGMSRLGVLPDDLAELIDWFVHDGGNTLVLEGVMTHLACADDIDDELTNARQLAIFGDCLRAFEDRGLQPELRHAANSAALVRFRGADFDMVRPGIALYGSASSPQVQLDGVHLAMRVRSQVLGVRELPAGVRVSYGGRDRLERASRLAIVPVGYGDGYPRSMSGKAQMLVRGHRCRVLGNITMDVCMLDVTDLPDVRIGEEVVLLGGQGREHIAAQEMATWAKILPYEVFCGVSKRVPRRYG